MAEKRMFSKKVIESGRFLTMPPSARLLYYDLGMRADDDGVVEAVAVMQQTRASEDDLRILCAKGLVTLLNDDMVMFINDWLKNNTIQSDRYHESEYKELLLSVVPMAKVKKVKPKQLPALPEEPDAAAHLRNVSNADTEIRFSIGLDNICASALRTCAPESRTEDGQWKAFWDAYPKRKDKTRAEKAWRRLKPDGALFATIMTALETAKASPDWQRDGGQYIPYPASWINGRRWEDEISVSVSTGGDDEEIW